MTTHNAVRERSYEFAKRIIGLVRYIGQDRVTTALCQQLMRAGTSIGANVEEAQAAQSKRDFVHKMSIARKESREAHYWLRLFRDCEVAPPSRLGNMIEECDQLVRILTSIVRTAEARQQKE